MLDLFSSVDDPARIPAVHDAHYLWVYEGTPALRALTTLPLEAHHSYLLERSAHGNNILIRQEFPASWVPGKK